MIYETFNLSAFGDGFGALRCDYVVCRDYCDKYDLDRIEVWRAMKTMLGAYNKQSAAKAKVKGKGR
jgi:hypothetical protein